MKNKTISVMFNTLWLQGVLDKIRQKIQRLEKAIQTQREDCKEPCKTKCPIPVVSGKCDNSYNISVGGTLAGLVICQKYIV